MYAKDMCRGSGRGMLAGPGRGWGEDFWPYLHGDLPGPGVRFGRFTIYYASVHNRGDLWFSACLWPVCRRAVRRKQGFSVNFIFPVDSP